MKAWNDAIYRMYQKAPSSYRVDQLSAEVFETQGKYTEAIAEYRKAIEKNPKAINLHYRLGRALLQQSHDPAVLDQARKEFEAELALNPSDAVAEYQVAQILVAKQEKQQAAAHFERAAELRPDFPEALIAVAKLRSDAKRYTDAIALLERAVKLQPRNETAHYNLMMAYRNGGPHGRRAAGKGRTRKTAEASGRRVHGLPEAPGRQEVKRALALLCAGIAAAQNPDFRNVARQAGLTTSDSQRRQHVEAVHHRDHGQRRGRSSTTTTTAWPISSSRRARALPAVCTTTRAAASFATSPQRWASRAKAGRRASAPAITITTATPICSSPTGDRTRSIATSAGAASRTSPRRFISRRIAFATTPAAPSSITTTTASSISSSRIT